MRVDEGTELGMSTTDRALDPEQDWVGEALNDHVTSRGYISNDGLKHIDIRIVQVPKMTSVALANKSRLTKPPYYSAEEWRRYRAMITALYKEQGKTLKEVRTHLENEYGFAPT